MQMGDKINEKQVFEKYYYTKKGYLMLGDSAV